MPTSRTSMLSALATLAAAWLTAACAPARLDPAAAPPTPGFGTWIKDPQGLPAFALDPARAANAPTAPFAHLISAGRASALLDRWGNVRLITTEGGTTTITPVTSRTRGGLFAIVETKTDRVSLIHGELERRAGVLYGTGYGVYEGGARVDGSSLAVRQEIAAAPDDVSALAGTWTLRNDGATTIEGTLTIQSDVFVRPGPAYADFVRSLNPQNGEGSARFVRVTPAVGDVYLMGSAAMFHADAREHALRLATAIKLAPGQSMTTAVALGYGDDTWARAFVARPATLDPIKAAWRQALDPVMRVPAPEPWMRDEAVWTFGQMLSFRSRDASLDAPYYQLGGYSWHRTPDNPEYLGFPVREGSENALAMAMFAPDAARDALRWVARGQLQSGDIPKTTNLRADRDIAHMHFESDGEIWFLLASTEAAANLPTLFDERVAFWDGGNAPYFEHLARAFYWLRDKVGLGTHGLVLMRDGDWNDYLSRVGQQGRGESFMNTAMAARACDGFAALAHARGEDALAREATTFAAALRDAAGRAFDRRWFLIGYDDDGRPLGGADDRLYLNSQVWAALGRVGTLDERTHALAETLRLASSPMGLTLLSRPYASPPPSTLSYAVLPAGEGENGGVWPQTVYWAVWAFAEAGMRAEAIDLWKRMSLRNHSQRFPEVPFGIFNGPDCYSSAAAGPAEGWTQVQVFDRSGPTPMNPMVAWQAFALNAIARAPR